MKVRDLERLLVAHDAPRSFLDTVTRALRSESKLPIGGRGVNAPDIGPAEAAWVMLGLAGTDIAAQAGHAIFRLLELQLPRGEQPRFGERRFVDAVQIILHDPDRAAEVSEIRVGRSHALSQIIYRDGAIERYVLANVASSEAASVGAMKFRSEGVLTGELLQAVALAVLDGYGLAIRMISGNGAPPSPVSEAKA
jgi:hypothetical protein